MLAYFMAVHKEVKSHRSSISTFTSEAMCCLLAVLCKYSVADDLIFVCVKVINTVYATYHRTILNITVGYSWIVYAT